MEVTLMVEGGSGGRGALHITVIRRRIHAGVGRVEVKMPGMGLLDRDGRANGGLGEWGGARAGVPVVVKGIVLEERV
jgi:hypothetical protein